MKVGILALQGAVQPHEEKLKELRVESVQVRYPDQLKEIRGIILPGGESTTMIHLLKLNQLWGLKRICSNATHLGNLCGLHSTGQ